jgi:hypothetical protein
VVNCCEPHEGELVSAPIIGKSMTYLPNSNASPDPTHGSMLAAFEGWLDQQVLPPDIAEHANFVLAYLRMDPPLPALLRAKLAEHVAAITSRVA